jgi:hypothetical protein
MLLMSLDNRFIKILVAATGLLLPPPPLLALLSLLVL